MPVVGDIGSGLLAPHPLLPDEPDAGSWLRAGADLVTASGDKLLGGPQAGLLLGRAELVRQLARHPLARALRVDKLTIAALEATLARAAGRRSPQALAAEQAALDQIGRNGYRQRWSPPASTPVRCRREAAVGGGGGAGRARCPARR